LVWASPFAAEDWADLDHLASLQSEIDQQQTAASYRTATPEEIQNAESDAEAIVSQAQQKADEILRQAQENLDETQRQAMLTIEQARSEGYREGWEKADAEASSVLKSVLEIMLQVTAWRDDMFSKSEPIMIEMVKQIGRAMFGEGLTLDPKALEVNLNRVVENAKSLGDLKIYLNPHDAEHLDPAWREYQQLISGNRVQIVPSDGITKGGCFVQGQMGTVDARVETQMKAVLDVFNQDDGGENA
jgi:flagellar assembly protein FliH